MCHIYRMYLIDGDQFIYIFKILSMRKDFSQDQWIELHPTHMTFIITIGKNNNDTNTISTIRLIQWIENSREDG